MSDDVIYFDDDAHRYTMGDVVVPSVTQILKPWSKFGMVPAHILKPASERGKAVHLACHLDDEDDLDEDSLDDSILPYLTGWRQFKAEQGFVPTHVEQQVYCKKYGFAGTLDRRGIRAHTHPLLLDIKSGVECPTHGPQTAAYAVAVNEPKVPRWTVYLGKNGKYRIEQHKNADADFGVFLAALTYHNWRAQHGL